RSIADAGRTIEQRRNGGMGLEALKFIKGRQRRVGVVEMHDQPQIELPILCVIGKATAPGRIVEREAEIVVRLSQLVPVGRYLPDFLDAEAIFLRARSAVEGKVANDCLGQR